MSSIGNFHCNYKINYCSLNSSIYQLNNFSWLQCIKKDLAVKGLDASLVQNRNAWRRPIHSKSRSGRDNGVVQASDTENNAR